MFQPDLYTLTEKTGTTYGLHKFKDRQVFLVQQNTHLETGKRFAEPRIQGCYISKSTVRKYVIFGRKMEFRAG
jgi:hypothetical protein